jgi:hypothetical protein
MFTLDVTALSKLGQALMHGDDNLISRLIENKLEDLGKDLLQDLLPSEPAVIGRIGKAIETGGASEFLRARNAWLSSVTPAPLPGQGLIGRIQNSFDKNKHLLTRPEGKWQKWSKSRQQWLDERYRHDWRTQPRDYHGRWKVGRLRSPYVGKQRRHLRTMRRRAARKMARQIMAEMNRRGS